MVTSPVAAYIVVDPSVMLTVGRWRNRSGAPELNEETIWQPNRGRSFMRRMQNIGKVFSDALMRGPQVVITDGGGEVVIIAKERFDCMRLTPRDYVAKKRLDLPDRDQLDEMIERVRDEGIWLFGVGR